MRKNSWWKKEAVYEIYPKSFCDSNGDGVGDIPGIISKLDYLKNLGVEVLWLCPIYPSGGYDNGYDITDYENIDPVYGTMEDLKGLLDQVHRRGMKLILDLVLNHTSDRHPWFQKALADKGAPERAYYIWRDPGESRKISDDRAAPDERETPDDQALPNNWGALFGGSAWTYDEKSGQYYLGLFSSRQPDLNWDHPALRREIYDMMNRWLDLGVDGFRLDVISLIAKTSDFSDGPLGKSGYFDPRSRIASNPKVHDYLKEMRREVFAKKDLMTVGEASATTLEAAKLFSNQDGSELDMVFWFEHMDLDGGETFKWNDRRIPLTGLKQIMEKWQRGLAGYGWNALFWNNHDQPRMLSRMGDEGIYRERAAKMLAVCLHMMQGTVFLYQGEELGMTNMQFTDSSQLRDSESINAFEKYVGEGVIGKEEMLSYISQKSRDTSRTPMHWCDQAQGGFTIGEPWMEINPNYRSINAEDQTKREDSVYSFYRKLIDIRKRYSLIAEGDFALYRPKDPEVFAYIRKAEGETLFVCCNFSGERKIFPVPEECRGQTSQILIANCERSAYLETELLEPFEALVLYRKEEV